MSVEYRLAPEHPHPALVEDCYAGLKWTAEHAGELGFDPERIIVAGASAGGGLTAAVALLARDRGTPALLGQVLLCPMLDDRNDTPPAIRWPVSECGTARRTTWGGRPCSVTPRRPGRLPTPPRPAPTTSPGCPGLHRRRLGRDLPGRGRRLRERPVAGGRPGRTPRVARWLPRIRPDGAAGRPVPGHQGRTSALAAPAPGELTPSTGPPAGDGLAPGAGGRSMRATLSGCPCEVSEFGEGAGGQARGARPRRGCRTPGDRLLRPADRGPGGSGVVGARRGRAVRLPRPAGRRGTRGPCPGRGRRDAPGQRRPARPGLASVP